jgi:hypothetical protein
MGELFAMSSGQHCPAQEHLPRFADKARDNMSGWGMAGGPHPVGRLAPLTPEVSSLGFLPKTVAPPSGFPPGAVALRVHRGRANPGFPEP